jgi:hypothetical protein
VPLWCSIANRSLFTSVIEGIKNASMASNTSNRANDDLVRSTMAEVKSGREIDRTHILHRLEDWRDRTHALYDFIERTLGTRFTYDRTGKQRSAEELVQLAGLSETEVPALDILRIEQPRGTLRATIVPRGLWIIGANGRLDLRVLKSGNRQIQYFLVDKSLPLSGLTKAAWQVVDPAERLHQRPLTEEVLREVID